MVIQFLMPNQVVIKTTLLLTVLGDHPFFCFFQLLEAAGVPWLVATALGSTPKGHTAFPSSVNSLTDSVLKGHL